MHSFERDFTLQSLYNSIAVVLHTVFELISRREFFYADSIQTESEVTLTLTMKTTE